MRRRGARRRTQQPVNTHAPLQLGHRVRAGRRHSEAAMPVVPPTTSALHVVRCTARRASGYATRAGEASSRLTLATKMLPLSKLLTSSGEVARATCRPRCTGPFHFRWRTLSVHASVTHGGAQHPPVQEEQVAAERDAPAADLVQSRAQT
eukprot:scaffold1458_cov377-Prasinococcus_capsulatus_cf.AAC.7